MLGYIGYLAIALGPDVASLRWSDWVRGYERILEPAERRGALLRTAQRIDRVYFLTTQAERIVPLRIGRRSNFGRIRNLLHVDLWALEATTARLAWKRRLRTFEDRGTLTFELLGADSGTLWLFVREPIGVALDNGALVADGPRLESVNPALAGKRVDEAGYVAFGAQGLQLTLNDATQWIVDGTTLAAQPRDRAPRAPANILTPAHEAPYTSGFQLRGLPIGTRWLGVLTEEEATQLRGEAVVPGATPGERPGIAADFFARQHVPQALSAQPRAYQLWGARVTQVSAAPPGWSEQLPDNWGTRDQFSDYETLPDAPAFLQAGLLGDGRSERPFWFRAPDSVMVLHHDKLGGAGRLRLTRVAGPAGQVVWDAGLPLANLQVVAAGERTLVLVGTEPNPAHDPDARTSREVHEKIVSVNVAGGAVSTFDLTQESVRDGVPRQQAPRTVSEQQAKVAAGILRGFPLDQKPLAEPVTVLALVGDPEAAAYASQLADILEAGGWPTTMATTRASYTGVMCLVDNATQFPVHARALTLAFERAGIECIAANKGTPPSHRIEIVVGHQP